MIGWTRLGHAQTSGPSSNYLQYTNFHLTFGYSPTNPAYGVVTIVGTLPGLTYIILTNAGLGTTNWGIWQTLTATNSTTATPPIDVGLQNLYFKGQIFLSNAPYISNGLVAYWKLNDDFGSAAADSSGNGYSLYLSNSPAWGSNYLTLDGSTQFGDAGPNPAEFNAQDMSICAWVCQTSNAYKSIVDKSYDNSNACGGWGFSVQARWHSGVLGRIRRWSNSGRRRRGHSNSGPSGFLSRSMARSQSYCHLLH